ncbi:MAG: hypothetical protein AAFP19_14225 [Bacteroidota bacterium]
MMLTSSYTSGTSHLPLLGSTIGDQFDAIAEQYGDREALVAHHQDIRWTYRALKEQVDTCVRALMAWIKTKEGLELSSKEITAFCQDKIAYYKVPKYYKFTNDFPMTVTGKIRKVEMRRRSIEELGLGLEDEVKTA